MFAQDKEITIAIIVSTSLMLFFVGIIIAAVVKYQRRTRIYLQEMSNLKINYQEETIKAQIEREEQTLNRVSQEIHDNVGQILSLVKLNLNTLELKDCDCQLKAKIESTTELVGKAIHDLRQLSKSLNSIHLSQGYLSDSLNAELDLINKSKIFNSTITVSGVEKPFNPQKQLIIFRIIQEALNNIIKHAKATKIDISLNYFPQSLDLFIQDNGVGFVLNNDKSQNQKDTGTGIENMYNRAKIIGGYIEIKSVMGSGTSIHLSVPID
ncbi:MAG: histidine kinase [Bacteroidales bacterium]